MPTGCLRQRYDLADGFAQIRRIAGIPVLSGMPFGHAADKFTLPFGRAGPSTRDGTAGQPGFPRLSAPAAGA